MNEEGDYLVIRDESKPNYIRKSMSGLKEALEELTKGWDEAWNNDYSVFDTNVSQRDFELVERVIEEWKELKEPS